MENYTLSEKEVVLYKGKISFENKNENTELILTNINLVFINKFKKIFSEEEITTLVYPISTIKTYEDIPQIKANGKRIEIYFIDNEIIFEFYSKSELQKFFNEINKLLTGQTNAQRNAQKIKNAINLIDDTLGINTVEVTCNALKDGLGNSVNKGLNKICKSIFNKKKK